MHEYHCVPGSAVSLDLEAEADRATLPKSAPCKLCIFLDEQPADEQPGWDTFLAGDRPTRTVWRVLANHGFKFSDAPVYTHRQNGHRK